MDRKKLLLNLIVLMFIIAIADRIAHKFYWYSSIWWFDMPMHFLGGFWVGLFFLYVFTRKNQALDSILKVIICLFLIGILWELFEIVVNNHIGHDPFNTLDTISDICFDLAGGASAILYFLKRIVIKSENAVSL